MNSPKLIQNYYIDSRITTPLAYSVAEAAGVAPEPLAHDTFTRLVTRLESNPDALWAEARIQFDQKAGMLVVDDSTPDKPYARNIELVTRPWSGRQGRDHQ